LLVTLIRDRPRVLSKEELHRRLWPQTFVSDGSLALLIAEVRSALGETARQPRSIRTVHRHGYAFQGSVREVTSRADGHGRAAGHRLMMASGERMLVAGDNIVGRDPQARVWLDSPSVSRHHARIRVDEGHATIEDLGSKNGTYTAAARVIGVIALADGDALRFGTVEAVFRSWILDPTRTEGGST
jgi:hypothetical protein